MVAVALGCNAPQVPLVVLQGKDMRNSTNIFLVNLSVADLFVLVISTPSMLMEVNSGPEVWLLGEHMCKSNRECESMTHTNFDVPIRISSTTHTWTRRDDPRRSAKPKNIRRHVFLRYTR